MSFYPDAAQRGHGEIVGSSPKVTAHSLCMACCGSAEAPNVGNHPEVAALQVAARDRDGLRSPQLAAELDKACM